MAGHSHWANIQRTKGANDFKRAKLFTKYSKDIMTVARAGGGDVNFNPRLRALVTTARSNGMPVDRIEHAIKKGTGEVQSDALEEITYEGYGPGGVAFIVESSTENRNRTAADVRSIFAKGGGNMGGSGAVAWMFQRRCLFLIEGASEDVVMEATLEAGADDIKEDAGFIEVYGAPEKYDAIDKALTAAKLKVKESKFTYLASNSTMVNDEESLKNILSLIETLEDNEDVQSVYTNFDAPTELLDKLVK
jgi:YebC/PmpR family DNA-binding regulatory protein